MNLRWDAPVRAAGKSRKLIVAGGIVAMVAFVGVSAWASTQSSGGGISIENGIFGQRDYVSDANFEKLKEQMAAEKDAVDGVAEPAPGYDEQPVVTNTGEPSLDSNGDPVVVNNLEPVSNVVTGGSRMSNEALPLVPSAAGVPTETTSEALSSLGFLVSVSGDNDSVTAVRDDCLAEWAIEALPTYAGDAFVGTVEACGRAVAVMASGADAGVSDLISRALFEPEHADVKSVIFGPDTLGYASVRSSTGGVLVAIAAAD